MEHVGIVLDDLEAATAFGPERIIVEPAERAA